MVHPNVPAVMITPICPHSLSFRPIVVPAGVELKVRAHPLCLFWSDCCLCLLWPRLAGGPPCSAPLLSAWLLLPRLWVQEAVLRGRPAA